MLNQDLEVSSPNEFPETDTALEDLDTAEKEALAATLALCCSIFSTPPFDEKVWVREDEVWTEKSDIEPIYESVRKLICQNDYRIRYEQKEIVGRRKPVTTISLVNKEGNISLMQTEYPFEDLLLSYSETIKERDSLMLLRYINSNGESVDIDLTTNRLKEAPKSLLGYARLKMISPQDVSNKLKSEAEYYLEDGYVRDFLSKISPKLRTLFLGEIGKVPEEKDTFTFSVLFAALKKYKKDLPSQVVFFTKIGSGIEKIDTEKNALVNHLLHLYNRVNGSKMKYDKLSYPCKQGGEMIIYVLKNDE